MSTDRSSMRGPPRRTPRERSTDDTPPQHPHQPGLRRRSRDPGRCGGGAVEPPRQPRAAQARRPAAGVQLQAAWRVQQDRQPRRGRSHARHHHGQRRQPLAGRCLLGTEAGAARRDAPDDTPHQGGRGARSAPTWCCPATAIPTRRNTATGCWPRRHDLHPPVQGGRGARARRRRGAVRRQLSRRAGTLRPAAGRDRHDLHPPTTRS